MRNNELYWSGLTQRPLFAACLLSCQVLGTDFGCQELYLGPVLVTKFGVGVLGQLLSWGAVSGIQNRSGGPLSVGPIFLRDSHYDIYATTLTHYKYLFCTWRPKSNEAPSFLPLILLSAHPLLSVYRSCGLNLRAIRSRDKS